MHTSPTDERCSTWLGPLVLFASMLVGLAVGAADQPAGEPGTATEVSAIGRWAFQPPRDEFSSDALLDLRFLNEKVAGQHGFITRSKDGNDFAFGDGSPLRFWAVGDGAFDKNLARHARFLAKRGINMVRFHIPLAQDPALAIIQIQNEDSLLFWTSQGIKGAARKELRRQFAAFAAKKHGSLEKARSAWHDAAPTPDQDGADDFTNSEAALYMVWELTQHRGNAGQQQRCADQMQFFTETMHNFNKMIGDFLKTGLGCKQLVNAGNWRCADNVTMLDAERQSYTANDVIAVNRYYDGAHEGANKGWAICNGDRFTDESALRHPRELPLTLKQVDGFPVLVNYGGNPAQSRVADLTKFIHEDTKTIVSATGQLQLDYGRGLCVLTCPKAQGVTGFLKTRGVFKLADVEIRSGIDYATVLVVALDNKPLRESGKILVQVGTTERPMGWKTQPAMLAERAGQQVVSFGHAPWMIVRADVTLTLGNPHLKTARVLDPNGMPLKTVPLENSGDRQSFKFPEDSLYVIVE